MISRKNNHWAHRLKARKNPFIASANPAPPIFSNIGGGIGGAGISALFNLTLTDNLPKKWHIPMHGTTALMTLALPRSNLSAGIGGAMFYALVNEIYQNLKK